MGLGLRCVDSEIRWFAISRFGVELAAGAVYVPRVHPAGKLKRFDLWSRA